MLDYSINESGVEVERAGVVLMMCDGGGRRGDGLEQRELIKLRATKDGSHHSKDEATTSNSDDWGLVTHNPLLVTRIRYRVYGSVYRPSFPSNFPTLPR